MKRIIAVFLIANFASANIGNLCAVLFKRNLATQTKDDLTRLDFINKLDDANSFLRSLKVDSHSVELSKKVMQRIAVVDNQLYQGKYAFAHRAWRGIFRKVEVNYVYVSKQQKILDELAAMLAQKKTLPEIAQAFSSKSDDLFYREALSNLSSEAKLNDYISSTQKQVRKRNIIIGNNYYEYKQIREHLEILSKDVNCKDDCDKAVLELLNTMGAGAENVRLNYQGILNGQSKPSLKVLNDYVHSTPIVFETRLMKEVMTEFKAVLRDIFLQAGKLKKFVKFVERNMPFKKSKIMRIFNAANEGHIRLNHFPHINDISRKVATPEEKYFLLREANANFSGDEFLVSYSRRSDAGASDTWQDVKEFLQNSENLKMQEFYKRMTDADDIAKVLGDLPLNSQRSNLSKLLAILISGGSGYYYFNSSASDEGVVQGTIDNVTDVIHSVDTKEEVIDQVTRIIIQKNDVLPEEIMEEEIISKDTVSTHKEVLIELDSAEIAEVYADTLVVVELIKHIDSLKLD